MNPILRKILSVISGMAGVMSALLWHISSNAQINAASLSKEAATAFAKAQASKTPDAALIQIAVEKANSAADAFNQISLTHNNFAAIFAIVASICVAAILFTDD